MPRPQTPANATDDRPAPRMGLWAKLRHGLGAWLGLYGGCACRTLPDDRSQCDADKADKSVPPTADQTADPGADQNKCL